MIKMFYPALMIGCVCGFATIPPVPKAVGMEKRASMADPQGEKSTGQKVIEQTQPQVDADADQKKDKSLDDKPIESKPMLDSTQAEPQQRQTSRSLRLPRHFSGLVDAKQREAILTIQLEYRQRITEVEQELERLRQDELLAIEKLLTDAQRKLLEKKRDSAKNRLAKDAQE